MNETDEKNTKIVSSKFDYFFKWNRVLLRIMGIWPLEMEVMSKFEYLRTTLLTFVLAAVIASEWADLIIIWGQFDSMIDNLSASLAISMSLGKLIMIRWNFKTLQHCFAKVREDWHVSETSEDFSKMTRRAKIGRIFSITSPGFAICTAVFYSVLPLTLKNSKTSLETFTPFPLRAFYFFDTSQTPIYEFVYLAQSVACHTSSISHSAIDSFFAALALHACGQVEILAEKFRSVDYRTPTIRNLVDRHLRLIKFVETLEKVYSTAILGQLFISLVSTCSIGYKFIMSLNDGNFFEIAKFSFYLIAMLTEVFLYCYAGQCLIDESTRLSEAAYACPWYEMNKSDAEAFLMIQSQAQLPLQFTAFHFCVISHECFADILRKSATYLSVLRAVKSSIEP